MLVEFPHRRKFLKLTAGVATLPWMSGLATPAVANIGNGLASLDDGKVGIDIDGEMRTRLRDLAAGNRVVSDYSDSESVIVDGRPAAPFRLKGGTERAIMDERHGAGREMIIIGQSPDALEKRLSLRLYETFPGIIFVTTTFKNLGEERVKLDGWRIGSYTLKSAAQGETWSFSGSSHQDRRDWMQPVPDGFSQRNFMGMNASDYGGGTPVVDIWNADGGLAIAHIDVVPRQVSMPIHRSGSAISLAIESADAVSLEPDATITAPEHIIVRHDGDCFSPLSAYSAILQQRGLVPGEPCEGCYEPVWCAWGYERNFTVEEVLETLPKVKEMGLSWAVIDDGWQTSEGDWYLDPTKFPNGDADMKAMVDSIRAQGLKPRLWLAPLAVDPGTDMLRHDTDMLLLDQYGAVNDVSWWNAFTLCPAYDKTVENGKMLVRKIIGEWGFEGLKLDGHHLNGVAPCYNPAHNHARPEESVEGLQTYWKALFDEAVSINPDAVIELCPCGTSYAYHNLIGANQTVSSDPLSSWQIRMKGKVLKALIGPSAPYAGDHVELSDEGRDFASSVGIGAVVSTKFTWPNDTDNPSGELPPGGYKLTAEKEAWWKRWIDIYNAEMLPKGIYRGDLYTHGIDYPEAHAIEKTGHHYFSFYADQFDGNVELRGLGAGEWTVTDLWDGSVIATVNGGKTAKLPAKFTNALLLKAVSS